MRTPSALAAALLLAVTAGCSAEPSLGEARLVADTSVEALISDCRQEPTAAERYSAPAFADPASGDQSLPWIRSGGPEPGSRVLPISACHGACDENLRATVDAQTEDAVVVRVEADGRTDEACLAILQFQPLTVTLDRPLGDRLLVHAPMTEF